MDHVWTDANIEQLKTGWNGGQSAGHLAALIGATRNAVIGKLARLRAAGHDLRRAGLGPVLRRPSVASAPKPPAKPKQDRPGRLAGCDNPTGEGIVYRAARRAADLAIQHARPPEQRFAEGYLGQAGRKSLAELNVTDCRFPVDQPDGGVKFCGLAAQDGASWCSHHAARVFNQEQPK